MNKIENKQYESMTNKMVGGKYNIECITSRGDLYLTESLSLKKYDIKNMTSYKKYNNLKLENINGLSCGQLYFTTEDGELILVPVSYIISIFPVNDKEQIK